MLLRMLPRRPRRVGNLRRRWSGQMALRQMYMEEEIGIRERRIDRGRASMLPMPTPRRGTQANRRPVDNISATNRRPLGAHNLRTLHPIGRERRHERREQRRDVQVAAHALRCSDPHQASCHRAQEGLSMLLLRLFR